MKIILKNQRDLILLNTRLESLDYPMLIDIIDYGESRTLEQNKLMWAMLADVAKKVIWYGKRLTAENWKDIFTSALSSIQVVPNLDGTGFVAVGMSTSRMSKKKFSELIELMYSFGNEKEVRWSDPADILNFDAQKGD